MYKVIFMWKDNPAKSPEENDGHYFEVHTPIVIDKIAELDGFRGYVQNRVIDARAHDQNSLDSREAEPLFDRSVELYFDSEEAMRAVSQNPTAFADHPNFMDVDRPESLRVYVVSERIAAQDRLRV